MADFKVGDTVRRIGWNNGGDGACIGTIATVTEVHEDGFISVYYSGCYDDRDGFEIWNPLAAERSKNPNTRTKRTRRNL